MKIHKLFSLVPVLLLAAPTAFAVPTIQKDANYFDSLDADIGWFKSMDPVVPHSDLRSLFLNIYLTVSEEMPNLLAENRFNHPDWVKRLMFKYASLYKNALDCDLSGQCAVSPAWQTAFAENRAGKVSPNGQLLLSISAHVNRDLPVALASIPDTNFDDATYLQDFHTISLIFQRKMPDLIKVAQTYQSCRVNSVDYEIIMTVINHAINVTRDKSWNWGRTLSQTTTPAEEAQVMQQIEQHAHNEDISLYIFAPAPAFLICL